MNTNPIILQFDEDDSFFTVSEIICFNMGLSIYKTANNIDKARQIVREIESKNIKPDIAIISEYLGNSFQDGELLAKKLKSILPEIKIIAYVTDKDINWGDLIAIKGSKTPSDTLTMALSELTGKTFTSSNIKDSEY